MGKTTITVQDSTLERFKRLKAELDEAQDAPDHSADTFLSALLDTWEKVEQEGYGGEVSVNANVIEKCAARLERLDHDVSELAKRDGVSYEDIVNANRKALREELPDRVLQG